MNEDCGHVSDGEPTGMAEIVDRAAASLAEHFDSVQIFVTKHDGGKQVTRSLESGKGNMQARLGHVHQWLVVQDQYARNYAMRKDREDDSE